MTPFSSVIWFRGIFAELCSVKLTQLGMCPAVLRWGVLQGLPRCAGAARDKDQASSGNPQVESLKKTVGDLGLNLPSEWRKEVAFHSAPVRMSTQGLVWHQKKNSNLDRKVSLQEGLWCTPKMKEETDIDIKMMIVQSAASLSVDLTQGEQGQGWASAPGHNLGWMLWSPVEVGIPSNTWIDWGHLGQDPNHWAHHVPSLSSFWRWPSLLPFKTHSLAGVPQSKAYSQILIGKKRMMGATGWCRGTRELMPHL